MIKARELIHNGILIRLKNNYVIIENKCNTSVFWIRPKIKANLNAFQPNEIKSGRKVQVLNLKDLDDDNNYINSNVINLSFGKEWASSNKRTSIELCPCWISLNFNKNFYF